MTSKVLTVEEVESRVVAAGVTLEAFWHEANEGLVIPYPEADLAAVLEIMNGPQELLDVARVEVVVKLSEFSVDAFWLVAMPGKPGEPGARVEMTRETVAYVLQVMRQDAEMKAEMAVQAGDVLDMIEAAPHDPAHPWCQDEDDGPALGGES